MGLDECAMYDMVGTMLVYGCIILMNMKILDSITRKKLQCLHSFSFIKDEYRERHIKRRIERHIERLIIWTLQTPFLVLDSITRSLRCPSSLSLSLSLVRDKYIDKHT
jgi:hypothetical protein